MVLHFDGDNWDFNCKCRQTLDVAKLDLAIMCVTGHRIAIDVLFMSTFILEHNKSHILSQCGVQQRR